MPVFDKTKDYGTLFPIGEDGAMYHQNRHYFRQDGTYVKSDPGFEPKDEPKAETTKPKGRAKKDDQLERQLAG